RCSPPGKQVEIEVSRRYLGVEGKPARYLIIAIPPRQPQTLPASREPLADCIARHVMAGEGGRPCAAGRRFEAAFAGSPPRGPIWRRSGRTARARPAFSPPRGRRGATPRRRAPLAVRGRGP